MTRTKTLLILAAAGVLLLSACCPVEEPTSTREPVDWPPGTGYISAARNLPSLPHDVEPCYTSVTVLEAVGTQLTTDGTVEYRKSRPLLIFPGSRITNLDTSRPTLVLPDYNGDECELPLGMTVVVDEYGQFVPVQYQPVPMATPTPTRAPTPTPTATPTLTLTPTPLFHRLGGRVRGIQSLAWSPDGAVLASGSDATIILWDMTTHKHIRSLRIDTEAQSSRYHWVWDLAWSPDGTTLTSASGRGTYVVWNSSTGGIINIAQGTEANELDASNQGVHISPSGSAVLSAGWSTIAMYETSSAALLRRFEGLSDGVNCVRWSPDGQLFASDNGDAIVLWDATTGSQLWTMPAPDYAWFLAWSADGTKLATGHGGGEVVLWDPDAGMEMRVLEGHTETIEAIAWSPDGQTVAASASDGSVILWDASTGEPLLTLHSDTGYVEAMEWSPDGTTLAAGTQDDALIWWDIGALLE
jgi:WD40 repeat protein